MPAAVAVPLISAAASGATTLIGSKMQSNASRDAASREDRLSRQALDDARDVRNWQQRQYANYLERLRPYQQYGLNASSTLNNLMRLSPYARMANQGQAAPPQVPAPIAPMPAAPMETGNRFHPELLRR